jgi:hypothetical protein
MYVTSYNVLCDVLRVHSQDVLLNFYAISLWTQSNSQHTTQITVKDTVRCMNQTEKSMIFLSSVEIQWHFGRMYCFHLWVWNLVSDIKGGTECGMYAREVDVTRLRKRALLGNGRLQQYPDGVFYGVRSQAINPRERSSSREIGVWDIEKERSASRIELSRTAPRDRYWE